MHQHETREILRRLTIIDIKLNHLRLQVAAITSTVVTDPAALAALTAELKESTDKLEAAVAEHQLPPG